VIKGLNIEQSGGDGIYVDNCERVHIAEVNSGAQPNTLLLQFKKTFWRKVFHETAIHSFTKTDSGQI
jgi:hypothetical protein